MGRIVFLLAMFVLATHAATTAAEIRLDPETGIDEAVTASDVLRDPTGRWTLDDVLERSAAFRPFATLVPDVHAWALAPSTIWFRLRPRSTGPGPWYVHTTYDVDRGELFYVAPNGHVDHARFGTLLPYAERSIPNYANVFVLPAEATRDGTVYLRVVVRRDIFGGYGILPAAFDATVGRAGSEEQLLPGLAIAGMLLALSLFNAVLGLTLRERIYFWYAAATACFALYQTEVCGAAWRWLWPNASVPFGPVVYATYLAYFAMVMIFARDFLDLPTTQRSLWRTIVAIYAATVAIDIVDSLAPNVVDTSPVGPYIDAITSGVFLTAILASGAIAWRRGSFGAPAYTAAFGGVVVGLVIGNLGYNVLLPENGWTDAAPGLGVAWEAVFLALALAQRIRRLQTERDALSVAALVDALTGISNRRAFDRVLADEWRRAQRAKTSLSLVMLDVDYFKSFNDTYGHQSGDDALRAVARAISESLHRVGDFAARYGGEEFAVLLPYGDVAGAAALADAIRSAVAALGIAHADNPSGRLTISAGAACLSPDARSAPAQLIEAADRALYSAKNTGRNRVCQATALVA
jgi:diguanylate cyclase (GGDEF)-like protein